MEHSWSERVRLLTVEQVADLISMSRAEVYSLLRRGRLKSITIGRARRVPPEYLREFIESLMTESTEATDAEAA